MKTNLITANRFPEFFREEFPELITFIEEYYRYIEEDTFNGKLNYATDLDLLSQLDDSYLNIFLEHYRNQFAIDVPVFSNLSTIEFLRNAVEVYSHRGTEKCLKFLFRIAYNEEIDVSYPKFNMVRASESTWVREYHIRLFKINSVDGFKIRPTDRLTWQNDRGNFSIVIKKVTAINENESLIFFEQTQNFYIDTVAETNLQKFFIKRDGLEMYKGVIKKTLSHFSIRNPGKYWQKGTVFKIPGTEKDSILRIANTDIDGKLKKIDVLEYGWDFPQNSSIQLHALPKPSSLNVDINSVLTYVNAGATTQEEFKQSAIYHHYITILDDGTDGFEEAITCGSTIQTYMLSGDYYRVDDSWQPLNAEWHPTSDGNGYYGSLVFEQSTFQVKPTYFTDGSAYTFQQWKDSETILTSHYEYLVVGMGRFADWSGLLSDNQSIVQDSFYYQSFSYAIETSKSFREAETVIKFNHPAGTKAFVNSRKQNELKFQITGYRSITADFISAFDSYLVSDANVKHLTKPVVEVFQVAEQIDFAISKPFADNVSFQVWNPTDSYAVSEPDRSTWYSLNNDYNNPPSAVTLTSFFDIGALTSDMFFEGGTFFAKQLEIIE